MRRVERHGFAGAVDNQRYFEWTTRPDDDRGHGPVGREDVAARRPGARRHRPVPSPRDGLCANDTGRDLPEPIAEHLRAYATTT